jgi:hypothetical protein
MDVRIDRRPGEPEQTIGPGKVLAPDAWPVTTNGTLAAVPCFRAGIANATIRKVSPGLPSGFEPSASR